MSGENAQTAVVPTVSDSAFRPIRTGTGTGTVIITGVALGS